MKVHQVKRLVKEWVLANGINEPGYVGSYLVGSINRFASDADFPLYRDVDVTLAINDPNKTLLPQARHNFKRNHEYLYQGIMLEVGFRDFDGLRDPQGILTNPGRAPNFTVNNILTDPTEALTASQLIVAREYARRKWVEIRIADEKEVIGEMLKSLAASSDAPSPSHVVGIAHRFSGLLAVAYLEFPTARRCLVQLREMLFRANRLDLHERILKFTGYANFSQNQVEAFLKQAVSAFDIAVETKRSEKGSYKIHQHLRPYFLEGTREIIDDGFYQEAIYWINACFRTALSGIQHDGTEADKQRFEAQYADFKRMLGFDDPEECQHRTDDIRHIAQEIFALADEVVATNPQIFD